MAVSFPWHFPWNFHKYFDGDQDMSVILNDATSPIGPPFVILHGVLIKRYCLFHMAKIDWRGGGGLVGALSCLHITPSCTWWWYGVKGVNRPSSLSASQKRCWVQGLIQILWFYDSTFEYLAKSPPLIYFFDAIYKKPDTAVSPFHVNTMTLIILRLMNDPADR